METLKGILIAGAPVIVVIAGSLIMVVFGNRGTLPPDGGGQVIGFVVFVAGWLWAGYIILGTLWLSIKRKWFTK